MSKTYILRRPGKPPVETPYGSVDDILYERIPDQPVENPRLHGEVAMRLIRLMSTGHAMRSEKDVARELGIKDLGRIQRAREWLGLSEVEPLRKPTQDEQAADFGHFVGEEPEPPEAA